MSADANADDGFKSRFDGAYVAVTSGYDFSTPGQTATGYLTSVDALAGGKIGGTGGYNITSGRLLVGVEGRAQYGFAKTDGAYSYQIPGTSLPLYIGSCSFGCFLTAPYQNTYPLSLSYGQNFNQTLSRPFSGDISMRAGMVFGDLLIFGRAGIGAEYTKRVSVSDQSGTRTCNAPFVTPTPRFGGGIDYIVTSCGSVTSGPITTTIETRTTPTITLAGGFERNFGSVFVRAEAELLLHFPGDGAGAYYSPAGNVAVGYRF